MNLELMSHHVKKLSCTALLFAMTAVLSYAQGYLHTVGKEIVNSTGEKVLLKGIGTGNWMLMEGYMMKTSGVAGAQHEIREKLVETIGVANTDSFFNVWLMNHFTRADVDSMKAWGFNSVRVAMHYKWFTLSIEDEAIPGENTWFDKGFTMIDSALDWCGDNHMYLILDLHGAPGGQGKESNISDYDPTKPSLWESQANKDKTVALWRRLAERYSNEPWIGGYDLINETNWPFPDNSNTQLKNLLVNITNAIREVDKNHIIFIEGNSFANDFSGLMPPWDNNFVYSFHKYWSNTGPTDLDWVISLRNAYNVPLWLGESGENSNTWFTQMITLSEQKNIGWSWWPVKKSGINNVLGVTLNKDYEDLVKYWSGEIATKPTVDKAFQAVLKWADNHKIENCKVQRDVIDAMMRQPNTDETIPFRKHKVDDPIFFTDFDLGKNGIAYFDKIVANYGGEDAVWNTGWSYRNDGVDIEPCTDSDATNGFDVGWTEAGEWMQYTLVTDSAAVYTLQIRHASGTGGSVCHIEVNNVPVTGGLVLPGTGGWKNWETSTFPNMIVHEGVNHIKFVVDKGGSNLNYFRLGDPAEMGSVNFEAISAETSEDGKEIFLYLNKEVTIPSEQLLTTEFTVHIDDVAVVPDSLQLGGTSTRILILTLNSGLYSDNAISLSYGGELVKSLTQNLEPFSRLNVKNNMAESLKIPGKIQAENFTVNNGLVLEDCSDTGGGQNTGFANNGDYLVYRVHVTKTGEYNVIYRVATERSNAEILFQVGDGTSFTSIDTIKFNATGGWQTWQVQSSRVYLEEGYYFIRLFIKQGEHNLNWFQLNYTGTPIQILNSTNQFRIYPNPAKRSLTLSMGSRQAADTNIEILNFTGRRFNSITTSNSETQIDLSEYKPGLYLLRVNPGFGQEILKFTITE